MDLLEILNLELEMQINEEEVFEEDMPPQEQEIRILEGFSDDFDTNMRYVAKQHILSFFEDKQMYCGGKIPKRLLLTEENVSIVLNYDIEKATRIIYDCLPDQIDMSIAVGDTTKDISIVSEGIKMLSACGVPQPLSAGMLCLYLRWVEGYDIEEKFLNEVR